MSILVTGVAGFIGFNLTRQLLLNNQVVIGIDNLNDYYDPKLKKDRLDTLREIKNNEINFLFYKLDLIDSSTMFFSIYSLCNIQIPKTIHLKRRCCTNRKLDQENPSLHMIMQQA